MQSSEIIRIDIDAVLRSRVPGLRRWLPRCVVRWLERLICQRELNDILENNAGLRGSSFCRATIEFLDVNVDFVGCNRLPDPSNRRVIFVSNHPLGGLDGMALIDFVASRYGVEPLFVVNDLLSAIEPLADVFVPINKHGHQSRSAAAAVDEAFASDRPVIIFPAGLCSRRIKGHVADLEWKKMFITKAIDSHRTIIPLFFDAENSSFFYKFANIRKRLGIKFNVEMIRLPREVIRARGSRFRVVVGEPVTPDRIVAQGETHRQAADRFRSLVYNLR